MNSADSGRVTGHRAFRGQAVLVPFLRLIFFVAAACVFAAALLLRSAHAEVAEVLWGAGAQVMRFPGVPRENPRELELNGIHVSFRTQTVEASVPDVLARYEAVCGTPMATYSARNNTAGYVACLDLGNATQDFAQLATRFLTFSRTGDLHELGKLRYAFARRATSGADGKTFLLTMWVDSAFDLYRMLPRPGADAAGRDLAGVPRPPGSRRILSAWEARQPSGIVVYRVATKSPKQLESFYRAELPRNGWTIIERHPSESIQIDGIRMLAAEKGGRLVTVLCRSIEDSSTILTMLDSEPS